MFKETVTYTDYNGVERTEDFYFNLTEAELTEMKYSVNGGLDAYAEKIMQSRDEREIVKIFKELLLKAYGEKSLDGRRFIKSDALREDFSQTEAFSKLFMKYATDEEAAAAFYNGIIPAGMRENAQKKIAASK